MRSRADHLGAEYPVVRVDVVDQLEDNRDRGGVQQVQHRASDDGAGLAVRRAGLVGGETGRV